MSDRLADLSDQLIKAALSSGADAADALVVEGTALSIEVLKGKIEKAERAEGLDLGLRVLVGQRQALISSSTASTDAIAEMAARAVSMARDAPEDATLGLAEPGELATQTDASALDLYDAADEPEPSDLQDLAIRAEAAALEVPGVEKVDTAATSYSNRALHLATSNGFAAGYKRTTTGLYAVAITGAGSEMERDSYGDGRTYRTDLPTPEEVGRLAGERTVERKGARKPPTGSYPVLYDERVSSSLIGHLLGAISGASVARGASWLRDAMGEVLLPEALDLVEDPHRPRISGSKPFDAEGLPTAPRKIIDAGRLTGWTLDLGTARKLGLKSTGNAARSTASPPSPAAHGVTLTQGAHSKEDLIRDMGTGLLITSMIGSSINATTGDYSRGASGFWVENGEIAYPVNECTVAGNLRDMLKTLVPANDARAYLSRVVPSCLIEGLTIAGE